MRSIPSKQRLHTHIWQPIVNRRGYDIANATMPVLRNLLVAWRDGRVKSQEMLEEVDHLLDGHGIKYLRSANGRAEAYYVNMGETYANTIILDTSKDKVEAMSWGDWVEKEERRGNKFD